MSTGLQPKNIMNAIGQLKTRSKNAAKNSHGRDVRGEYNEPRLQTRTRNRMLRVAKEQDISGECNVVMYVYSYIQLNVHRMRSEK